jgi:pilus assembly protein Flp/PilA
MNKFYEILWRLAIWKDTHGQDLIEYALLAGFVAVGAGATFPPVADNISTIYSKITSSLNLAGSQGG